MPHLQAEPIWLKAPTWLVQFPEGDHRQVNVKAWTKSEARAAAKRYFGSRDRLPVGTIVTKVA